MTTRQMPWMWKATQFNTTKRPTAVNIHCLQMAEVPTSMFLHLQVWTTAVVTLLSYLLNWCDKDWTAPLCGESAAAQHTQVSLRVFFNFFVSFESLSRVALHLKNVSIRYSSCHMDELHVETKTRALILNVFYSFKQNVITVFNDGLQLTSPLHRINCFSLRIFTFGSTELLLL